jgi:hypothetical protein
VFTLRHLLGVRLNEYREATDGRHRMNAVIRLRQGPLFVLVLVLVLVSFAAPANASHPETAVSTDDGSGGAGNTRLVVVGGSGVASDASTITISAHLDVISNIETVAVTDSSPIGATTSDADCVHPNGNQVICTLHPTSFRVDAGAGDDSVATVGGFPIGSVPGDFFGGTGSDTLTGNSASNVMDGGDGDDTLNGEAGTDSYSGGIGADTVLAADGIAESVDCGANTDSYVADATDTLTACETNIDLDGDGIRASSDNCPGVANPGQGDADADGVGDVCDADDDNDGVLDVSDNCPLTGNPGQSDGDGDGIGSACDPVEGGTDPQPPAVTCTVPTLAKGTKTKVATAAISDAGCVPGKVTKKKSSVKKGRLIRLKIAPGTVVPAGTAVDLIISKGK